MADFRFRESAFLFQETVEQAINETPENTQRIRVAPREDSSLTVNKKLSGTFFIIIYKFTDSRIRLVIS